MSNNSLFENGNDEALTDILIVYLNRSVQIITKGIR